MPRVVPAVIRAFDVLGLFVEYRTMSVPDVVARLGLPRSTAHELVHTLVAAGCLSPLENQPHQFALGLRLFELGSAYAANLDLFHEGGEVAREVAAACDETVQLAILDGNQVVYVAKVDSTRPVRLVSAVGKRLPAHFTGVGKMLLSRLSDEQVVACYQGARQLAGMTPNSITSLSQLLHELSQVRASGLAFDNCESNFDVWCVAAPVYDHEGIMAAALSIAVPIMRVNPERQVELARLAQKGADDLSRRLGYRPAAPRRLAVDYQIPPVPLGIR